MSTTTDLNGTGFSQNGIADALREQIGEPRRFKPKPCAKCGELIEDPAGPRTKYHDGCKPTRANGNGKAQQSDQADDAGKKADEPAAAPKRKRRAPARRRAAAKRTPPAPTSLTARLTADCDQELQRLNGELERLEKGIDAMRDEQAKLTAEREQVERVQKALVA